MVNETNGIANWQENGKRTCFAGAGVPAGSAQALSGKTDAGRAGAVSWCGSSNI